MELSIIIPTYNRSRQLAECLQSLEHNDAEFIVIDDGSATPAEVPPNVCLIRHERNRGRAAAVNTGLRAAGHDLVLVIDDDIYAAPDLVTRLVDEFVLWNNPALALMGRVVWDPEVQMTLTMRWLEEFGPLRDVSANRSGIVSNLATANTMMWRPFVLQHGGFDERFRQFGLADIELGLRLKKNGLEVRLLASAIGFHHETVRVRDLVNRELQEGFSAVFLHSKFPDYLPQIDDVQSLMRNAAVEKDAAAAVEEIALLEQADSNRLPTGVSDLFLLIHRYYFLTGILNGLRSLEDTAPPSESSATLSLYNHALQLESIGELGEARRLFRLVRSRQDSAYWGEAEYHLGRIEAESGDLQLAHDHFMNCLTLDPTHINARERLKLPETFREIHPNVFERIEPLPAAKILFAVFGDLEDILWAFPIVDELRRKFQSSEIVWLTSPCHASLARSSSTDGVYEFEPRCAIPWNWVVAEGFTHIFLPETKANSYEWVSSGLHPIDFMAQKCGVTLASRRTLLKPGPGALDEADAFLIQYELAQNGFLTISHTGGARRLWPAHNLHKLAKAIGLPVVVIGSADEAPIAGTIPFLGRSYLAAAALIQSSAFYVGPDSGLSWIAATTNTPMGVSTDFTNGTKPNAGFVELLRNERKDLVEWDAYAMPETSIENIAAAIQVLSTLSDTRTAAVRD